MNCRKVNQLLSAYMDGELRGVEQRQVFEHLARCAECDQEYESFLQMKRMLGCMRAHQPTAELEARISYALTWEEAQSAGRTPAMLWMRMRLQLQDLFASPQGWSLGAIAVLGLYAIVHHLPIANATASTSAIVWQQTPNSVTELTAGLAPSASERFFEPPALHSRDGGFQESSRLSPVNLSSFGPAQPVQNTYSLDVFQPR
ncbi:MAG: putative zinc-finger [Chthonomonadaceae bacterium]|nr:putative zinc-finger [Chthonomonadaceae bacterium]